MTVRFLYNTDTVVPPIKVLWQTITETIPWQMMPDTHHEYGCRALLQYWCEAGGQGLLHDQLFRVQRLLVPMESLLGAVLYQCKRPVKYRRLNILSN